MIMSKQPSLNDNSLAAVPEDTADVLNFARCELRRCLKQMTGEDGAADGIALAVGNELVGVDPPAVANAYLDDSYDMALKAGCGFVAGSNPRAVLLGVYRLLRELGCRWVRPGAEFLPWLGPGGFHQARIEIREAAAHRHRGVCIEGAASREQVLNMIAWLPQAGFNSYFIQFRDAFTFYDRWYRHTGNPDWKEEPFDRTQAASYTAEAAALAKSRGLLYHAVGHGWTCEAVGIPGVSWEPIADVMPDETRELLAEVGGRRRLFNGIPLNTNLCYGNPVARRKIEEEIVRYACAHPEVDYLHFWLADDVNNQCECARCANTRPADFYLMMLNGIDRALSEACVATRIVLLCYLDLLWPPERERLANPGRFILMFAPISRSFAQPLPAIPPYADAEPPLPPYRRNQIEPPRGITENLAFFEAWQRVCPGLDTFDFDYHLMWDHFRDPGHRQVARVLHADTGRLKRNGLNGLISCQIQRVFLPTSLPMHLLGRGLWNPAESSDKLTAEIMAAEFGESWRDVSHLLDRLSRLFAFEWFATDERERGTPAVEVADGLAEVPGLCRAFAQAATVVVHTDPVHAESWANLLYHLQICIPLSQAMQAIITGGMDESLAHWQETLAIARKAEPHIAPVFDLCLFATTFATRCFEGVGNPFAESSASS